MWNKASNTLQIIETGEDEIHLMNIGIHGNIDSFINCQYIDKISQTKIILQLNMKKNTTSISSTRESIRFCSNEERLSYFSIAYVLYFSNWTDKR